MSPGPQRPLRVLTFSTLFPNREQPNHGIFVENRLRHLVNGGEVDSVVVAPIPYFPSGAPCLGEWSRYARIERQERRHGIAVHHPRFPVVPRIGMTISPLLLAAAMFAPVRRLYQAGAGFELIDAHYFFPDGVAALLLGRRLGCPVVVTARGSDINLIPGHPVPRAMIRWAIREADGLIAVSSALKEALVELGADPEAIEVLRNGVDPETFRPVGRDATRRDLGLTRSTLLSVGHLIERKGHDRVIAAMPELADFELLIVGDGPQRERLEALRHQFGVADRVRLLGAKPHDALPAIYSAADALVLASSREGWANVLLEAMACGTPVIASAVWGNPEVVCAPEAGILMDENTPQGIARAARALFANLPTRAATRIFAERFGWDETSRGQLALFRRVLQRQTEVAVA